MKKISFLIVGALISMNVFAQPDVTSAYNANKAGEYDKAVGFIEKALGDPKANVKEKTWRYRGMIYSNGSKDPSFVAKYPGAAQTAKESFFKAMEIDSKNEYILENQGALAELQVVFLDMAQKEFQKEDFCKAAEGFYSSKEISEKFNILDSAAIFNAAFCYDRCGKTEQALAGYAKSAEIGYNVPDVYMYMAEIHTKSGDKDKAMKVLTEARAKYPKDSNLLRTEVNVYLTDNQYDKAEALLKSLAENDQKNETVWFVLGVTYEKLGKKAEQESSYRKAVEIKPDYYDALFNLGAMYFNDGLEKEKICNEIPPRETAKYNDCTSQCKILFGKAVEFLERAQKLKPQEKEIMSALKDAYYKAENMDGYNKMKTLLGGK
jgi:tetratricopeptide (TPR) repeat protein